MLFPDFTIPFDRIDQWTIQRKKIVQKWSLTQNKGMKNQVFDYSFGVVTFVKTVFLDGVQNVQIMVESLCPKEINYAWNYLGRYHKFNLFLETILA